MKMYSVNADALAASMASLLEDAGMLEKQASDEAANTELDALAGSLITVADQLDQAGLEEAAARVDQAVSDISEHLPKCPNCAAPEGELTVEPAVIAQASATTLIRLADRFDAMGHKKIVHSIDGALAALAGKKKKDEDEEKDEKNGKNGKGKKKGKDKCECDCKKCENDKHCAKCGCESDSKKKLSKRAAPPASALLQSVVTELKAIEGGLTRLSLTAGLAKQLRDAIRLHVSDLGRAIKKLDPKHPGVSFLGEGFLD